MPPFSFTVLDPSAAPPAQTSADVCAASAKEVGDVRLFAEVLSSHAPAPKPVVAPGTGAPPPTSVEAPGEEASQETASPTEDVAAAPDREPDQERVRAEEDPVPIDAEGLLAFAPAPSGRPSTTSGQRVRRQTEGQEQAPLRAADDAGRDAPEEAEAPLYREGRAVARRREAASSSTDVAPRMALPDVVEKGTSNNGTSPQKGKGEAAAEDLESAAAPTASAEALPRRAQPNRSADRQDVAGAPATSVAGLEKPVQGYVPERGESAPQRAVTAEPRAAPVLGRPLARPETEPPTSDGGRPSKGAVAFEQTQPEAAQARTDVPNRIRPDATSDVRPQPAPHQATQSQRAERGAAEAERGAVEEAHAERGSDVPAPRRPSASVAFSNTLGSRSGRGGTAGASEAARRRGGAGKRAAASGGAG